MMALVRAQDPVHFKDTLAVLKEQHLGIISRFSFC
jgi:hypothetical protein